MQHFKISICYASSFFLFPHHKCDIFHFLAVSLPLRLPVVGFPIYHVVWPVVIPPVFKIWWFIGSASGGVFAGGGRGDLLIYPIISLMSHNLTWFKMIYPIFTWPKYTQSDLSNPFFDFIEGREGWFLVVSDFIEGREGWVFGVSDFIEGREGLFRGKTCYWCSIQPPNVPETSEKHRKQQTTIWYNISIYSIV